MNISLLIEKKQEAHDFISCLIDYTVGPTLLKERIIVNKHIGVVESTTEARYVYKNEYKSEDSDSPPNTLDDIQSATEVVYSDDAIFQRHSLENFNDIVNN